MNRSIKNKKFNKKFSGKGGKSSKFTGKTTVKTRKEIRKDERQRKKNEKFKSYFSRLKNYKETRKDKNSKDARSEDKNDNMSIKNKISDKPVKKNVSSETDGHFSLTNLSKENMDSKRDLKNLEKKMKKQRLQALKAANEEDDRVISSLEKQLRLNKRKSKSLPASFSSSGLDYILDVCNPEKMKDLAESEKYLQDSGSEFEDDLATIKGRATSKKRAKKLKKCDSDDDFSFSDNSNSSDNFNDISLSSHKKESNLDETNDSFDGSEEELTDDVNMMDALEGDDNSDTTSDIVDSSGETNEAYLKNPKFDKTNISKKRKNTLDTEKGPPIKNDLNRKKIKLDASESNDESDEEKTGNLVLLNPRLRKKHKQEENCEGNLTDDGELFENENSGDEENDETWEDIYGRTRDKQGNVVEVNKGKYLPPALRAKALGEDVKKREALERLRRQLKGLLNRLAESNMNSIATQVEELYMKNSRNDMNETLISLFTEAIVSPVHTPERLIMEHAMLTAILHANIGTEVGAYILQTFVNNFDSLLNEGTDIGDKRLDNLLAFICHLYSFKVFDNSLLYDILGVLCDKFREKEIELILVVLRNSGFSLRKDDPLALKELVLKIQRLASAATEQLKNDSRVNFMLDVLLKIKNNNMSKLPQYDPSHSEHLKKVIKSLIRKGNYVTELKISLNDLLKADERGRWWIVGSAWTGPGGNEQSLDQPKTEQSVLPTMSDNLTQLAKKLRINTDIRKNIFSILITAEDFEEAFEKLLRLGLKGQTMNEIIHVLLHCLLQEKEYNHYYALIANRFSQTDRKYRMVVQYSLWDKFKEVENMKQFQVTNLAKFLAFLFIEGTLPLSTLKVIQLVEMTKGNVRLIRQILLAILHHKDETTCASVFVRLNKSAKLRMFREGLRLFLHHFLLKNIKDTDQDHDFLKQRINLADKALQSTSY